MASVVEVTDVNHSSSLLLELNEQRLKGMFCDITVIVEDTKFKAHKNVLAASSPYFKEVLSGHASWLRDQMFELPDIQAEVFSNILNFIYNSRLTIQNLAVAREIATVGRRLGISCLENLGEATQGCRRTDLWPPEETSQQPLTDISQNTQGTKETSLCDLVDRRWGDAPGATLNSTWTPETTTTSRSLLGGSISPVDLTSPSSRRSAESGSPPTAPCFQNPSIQLESIQSIPSVAPPIQGQGKLQLVNHMENGPIPVAPNKDSEAQGLPMDTEAATAETAKILYALSTVPVNESLSSSSIASEVEVDQDTRLKNRDWDHISLENAALEVDGSEHSMNDPSSVVASSGYSSSTFHCRLCNRSFSSSTALSLHVKLHRPRRTLACRYCGKSFIHVKRLQTHEVLCKQTERIPVGNESSIGPKEQDFGEGACSSELLCHPSTAKQISSKKDHLGLLFRHRSFQRLDLIPEQDHFVKVVDGHLIYFCTVCERSYMTLSSLKRHSNVHSWRRKYPCRYCDKVFALAEYRTKHEVWHTGERRYQCIFCWETFVTYYNLKTHQKAFHGINPGLISSEKTPNGGYKPKVNALKLYRLLPMRSQKRPYKTYSQSLSENLMMPSQSLPLSIGNSDSQDGNLEAVLTSSDASSVLFSDKPASLQTDPSSSRQEGLQEMADPQGVTGHSSGELQIETALQEFGETLSSKHALSPPGEKSPKLPPKMGGGGPSSSGGDSSIPSVIAYGHPSSSVIIHSTSLSSAVATNSVMPSVITYNSKSTFQNSGCGPPLQSQPSILCSRQSKKHNLKDCVPPLPQKPTKLVVSTDQSTEGSGSDDEEEEEEEEMEEQDQDHRFRCSRGKTMTYMAKPAYVGATSESRSAPLCQITVRIGEEAIVKRRISETDLMRDKSPCGKVKRFSFGSDHVEHRIKKTEKHARDSERKTKRSLGQDTCDEDSERDTEDHLWRPYYTYKPKRKACSVQKVKKSHWRRKLRYKRSLRWIKRTEKEENARDLCSTERSAHQNSSKDDTKGKDESCHELTAQKQNHDTAEWKYECTTCGKQFMALKRLQKHEKAHSKDRPTSTCEHCPEESNTASQAKENKGPELNTSAGIELSLPFKSNAHRVGRKPLVKHICVSCTKVCKTAAALGRHMKRHETEVPSQVDDASKRDGESQDLSSGQVAALTTVIAYSKKSEEGSPLKEAAAVEELDCEGSLPLPRTIKEENPQEMKVSSSSEDQAVAMETEADHEHLYSSPSSATVHSVSNINSPVHQDMVPDVLEAHNATPPVAMILKVNSCEDSEPMIPYTDRGSPADHLTDTPLSHSQTPPLERRSELQEPHTNQDPKMQQDVMSYTTEELVEAVSGPPADRTSNLSPRLQREAEMPCMDEGAPLSEAKIGHINHHTAVAQERVAQQATEAQMGISSCKGRVPPPEDLSVQDPVISHTGGRTGLSLAQKCPPPNFQSTLQHELCPDPRFPLQEYPLPLLAPGAWATRKEMEEKPLLSYPSTLQFSPMGKVPNSNAGKVTFYPDPYPLMYGHQLLAYPYNFSNLTALPVALNMVIPDEKGQPLPFLPSMFGYTLNPCRGELQESATTVGVNGGPSHGKGETAEQERLKKGSMI